MLRNGVAAAALLAVVGVADAAERAGEKTRVQAAAYQRTGQYPFDLHRGDDIYRDANVSTCESGSVSMRSTTAPT